MADTISEVLRAVRLSGAVFFAIDASSPWVAETPASTSIAHQLLPGAQHVIPYHVVTKHGCWGGLAGEPPVRVEAGDVILFPQGDTHVLSSAPGLRSRPDFDVYRKAGAAQVPLEYSLHGGGEETATIVCGFLGCDATPFNPLLSALPRVIHLRSANHPSMHALVDLALAESSAPKVGSAGVLSQLSELLFMVAIRHYLDTLPPHAIGWFAGLRDDNVGRALQQLHERPAHPWTLDDLARAAGVSRSLLAQRFSELVGTPPMQYLTQWRLQLAASLLCTSGASLAEIAVRVGYGSEASLSRAFKRATGVAPATYRRERQGAGREPLRLGAPVPGSSSTTAPRTPRRSNPA